MKKNIEKIERLERENARLNALLGNNNNNSGIPTSKVNIGVKKRIPNSREKTGKAIGGQYGHKKHSLSKFKDEEITDTVIHQQTKCSCGCKDLEVLETIEKDVIDFKIITTKTRHKYNKCKCKKCNKVINAEIPKNQTAECSYGENVKSLILLMLNDTNAPFNKIRKLITGITNDEINISEGYIAKLQKECSKNLDSFIANLKAQIITEEVLHWDDTVITINAKNACFRFYGTNKFALYASHLKKNKDGMDEDSIFKNLTSKTTLMHDHLTCNYNPDYLFNNAECNAHTIRELKKVYEVYKNEWASKFIHMLVEAKENDFNFNIDKYYNEYDKLIEEGLTKYCKYTEYKNNIEYNLLNRLKKYKENHLMFLEDIRIPFTNNLAERSLRMCKSKMKVSGQFKNIDTARYYANVRSYIETCIRHNINPYLTLSRLQKGNPLTIKELKKSVNL